MIQELFLWTFIVGVWAVFNYRYKARKVSWVRIKSILISSEKSRNGTSSSSTVFDFSICIFLVYSTYQVSIWKVSVAFDDVNWNAKRFAILMNESNRSWDIAWRTKNSVKILANNCQPMDIKYQVFEAFIESINLKHCLTGSLVLSIRI